MSAVRRVNLLRILFGLRPKRHPASDEAPVADFGEGRLIGQLKLSLRVGFSIKVVIVLWPGWLR